MPSASTQIGATPELPATDALVAVSKPATVVGQFEIPQAVTAAGFVAGRERGATTILNPAPAASISDELLESAVWSPEYPVFQGD